MCREKYTPIPVAAQIEKPPLKAGGRPFKSDWFTMHCSHKMSRKIWIDYFVFIFLNFTTLAISGLNVGIRLFHV